MISNIQKKTEPKHSTKGQTSFFIKLYHLDNLLEEPKMSDLDNNDLVVNVTIGPIEPDLKLIGRNPFASPEYWLSKGYKIQMGGSLDKKEEEV